MPNSPPAKPTASSPKTPLRPTPRLLTPVEVRENRIVVLVGDEVITTLASPLNITSVEITKALVEE